MENEKYFQYLDTLRESGIVNMFGARPYLMNAYPELDKESALTILSEWARTFGDRHRSERGAD